MIEITRAELVEASTAVSDIRTNSVGQLTDLPGNLRTPEVLVALINAQTQLLVVQLNAKSALAVVDHSMAVAQKIAELN